MPTLILILGILIGGWALYRFMLRATIREVKAMVLTVGTMVIAAALFFLAVTGRLPAALGIVAALTPVAVSWWNGRKNGGNAASYTPHKAGGMTRAEALDILGLKGDPSDDEIVQAYKRLIKKVHPDQQGSEGLAKTINMAKDFLIKDGQRRS